MNAAGKLVLKPLPPSRSRKSRVFPEGPQQTSLDANVSTLAQPVSSGFHSPRAGAGFVVPQRFAAPPRPGGSDLQSSVPDTADSVMKEPFQLHTGILSNGHSGSFTTVERTGWDFDEASSMRDDISVQVITDSLLFQNLWFLAIFYIATRK